MESLFTTYPSPGPGGPPACPSCLDTLDTFCVSVDDRSHSSTIPALYTPQNGVRLNLLMRRLRGDLMTSYVAVPAAATSRWPPVVAPNDA